MKTIDPESSRRRGRALSESSVLRSSRYGISWALGAFATLTLIGGMMVTGFWDRGALTAFPSASGGNEVVLTADTAPPALWSNAWLGRHPYRAVAFHGLRRFATGFTLTVPHKPATFRQYLLRVGPAISARLVRFRDIISAEAKQTLVARAWL